MDLTMTFSKLRETQADFFGKKGISWHFATVITTATDEVESQTKFDVQTFIHILQLGTQGWFSVAYIVNELMDQLQTISPNITEIFLKSDNAGCYHCAPLLSYINHRNVESPIRILEYNFSESQNGKDICDAKTAHCKMHILRYVEL